MFYIIYGLVIGVWIMIAIEKATGERAIDLDFSFLRGSTATALEKVLDDGLLYSDEPDLLPEPYVAGPRYNVRQAVQEYSSDSITISFRDEEEKRYALSIAREYGPAVAWGTKDWVMVDVLQGYETGEVVKELRRLMTKYEKLR